MVKKPAASKDKKEEIYIIPELDIRVSKAWLNFIVYCQSTFPHGEISIKIVNGQPTEMIDKKEKIRFDRESI